MVSDNILDWNRFVEAALHSITSFRDRKIDLFQAVDDLEKFDQIDRQVIEFVCDCITEQIGNPVIFVGLIALLSRHPSVGDVKAFMEK